MLHETSILFTGDKISLLHKLGLTHASIYMYIYNNVRGRVKATYLRVFVFIFFKKNSILKNMPKRKSTEVGKSPSSATKRQKTASSAETKSKKKSPRETTSQRKLASINTASPKEVVKKKASPKKSASTRKTSSKAAKGKKTSAKTDDDDDDDDETDGKVSSSKQKKTHPKLVDPATNKETVKKD